MLNVPSCAAVAVAVSCGVGFVVFDVAVAIVNNDTKTIAAVGFFDGFGALVSDAVVVVLVVVPAVAVAVSCGVRFVVFDVAVAIGSVASFDTTITTTTAIAAAGVGFLSFALRSYRLSCLFVETARKDITFESDNKIPRSIISCTSKQEKK